MDGWCSTKKRGVAVRDFIYSESYRRKGEIYKGCSCFLEFKQASPESTCPLGKWLPEKESND